MRKLRFGVFGLGRGFSLIRCILKSGADVVAVCDRRLSALEQVKRDIAECADVAEYTDFDRFIQHDMDAVLLCNYFCDHTEYAIAAMRAGKHVLSETISNVTMAQGVALCRAKEETGKTFGLLENYPYFKENLEMMRVYKGGTLGELVYAEGEYVHPMSPEEHNRLAPGKHHWRNWTPRTYYSTHALAPLMRMTDSMPTRVSAMASFCPEIAAGTGNHTGDAAAVILCQTDRNAVLRVIGWGGFAPHGNYYRLCCTKGGMETNHTSGRMRLIYNPWSTPEGEESFREYDFDWPDAELGKKADGAGHGGGDFLSIYDFVRDLEEGREPYFDVYRSTALASVAILSWRSVLDGVAYDIPDFRLEEDRVKYENDHASPFPKDGVEGSVPCSSRPYRPSEEDLKQAQAIWQSAEHPVE